MRGIVIVIWGFRNRTTTRGQGGFHCPGCDATRSYQQKRVARMDAWVGQLYDHGCASLASYADGYAPPKQTRTVQR